MKAALIERAYRNVFSCEYRWELVSEFRERREWEEKGCVFQRRLRPEFGAVLSSGVVGRIDFVAVTR